MTEIDSEMDTLVRCELFIASKAIYQIMVQYIFDMNCNWITPEQEDLLGIQLFELPLMASYHLSIHI